MNKLLILFIVLSTSYAYAQQAIQVQDRKISGYKANVKKVGSEYALQQSSLDKGLQVQIDYTGGPCGTCAVYVGWADPAALTSAASWRIIKLEYDGTNVDQVQFGNQVSTFTLVWDDRASLDYTP
jgi:hypothetical protein